MNGYANSFYLPLPRGGDASFFYQKRQLERKAVKPTKDLNVAAIANVDNLGAVYEQMKRDNGPAPGPDRVRFDHLGRSELFAMLRPLSKAILDGTYRPGAARTVKIPKGGNRGYRTLTLRNLADRVVAKALNEALVPFWEKIFLDSCHSYRPKRSNWTMLAQLEHVVVEQDRWVIVSDDIKNAFPSVNIDLVMDDHRRHLVDHPELLHLIETILRGGDGDRRMGLDQGCPYMPAALNVHLHHLFDVYARESGANQGLSMPSFRYADNVVIACRDIEEGQEVLRQMTQRLATAGLTLKGENDGRPVDLRRGKSVQLLGFVIFKQREQVAYKLGQGAWDGVKKNLLAAHEANDPNLTAAAGIDGWIESFGPAFRKKQDRTVAYLLQLAVQPRLPGGIFVRLPLEPMRRAYQRWKRAENW